MSKHTPGPWQLNAGKRQTITDAEGGEIATIAQGIDANPADAALIAAAPELLEALKALAKVSAPHLTKSRRYLAPATDEQGEYTAYLEETTTADELDAAIAAIAKATGEQL